MATSIASDAALATGEQAFQAVEQLHGVQASHSSSTSHLPDLPSTCATRLASKKPETILYLAYGSNLSSETFRGRRGIKPLSSLNVHIPTLNLTFDLAGIPYIEPCFANSSHRDPSKPHSIHPTHDYHKDRWHKGLIGVVYEVTPEDYRIIIATEGGGASYQDIVVECYAIAKGTKTISSIPSGTSFKAHTLLCPRETSSSTRDRVQRPDPSYAQPSARYLKLITDGGEEHDLPEEYMHYLYNIRPFAITTERQIVGQVLFMGIWMPFVLAIFTLGKVLADKHGKIPSWLTRIIGVIVNGMWKSYDLVFKRAFGDGERTIDPDRKNRCAANADVEWGWCKKRLMLDDADAWH